VRKQEEGKFCRYQDEDIMGEIYPKILAADGLLLATPAYIARLSGYLAKFLDRFRCLAEGNLYRGSLEGKAVGALGVLWLRNCGAETTLLSIVEGAMHLGMFPIHAMRKMTGASYGAVKSGKTSLRHNEVKSAGGSR
jgi:multimeric flavodoxin WrbA